MVSLINRVLRGLRDSLVLLLILLTILGVLQAVNVVQAAPIPPWVRAQIPLTTTLASSSPQFTVPASADFGIPILPNIRDPDAVDAQTVCPGYTATDVQESKNGFTAALQLAGNSCNAYGTDVANLKLSVEYQSATRLAIHIEPAVIVSTESKLVGTESTTNLVFPRPFFDHLIDADKGSSNYSHYVLPETLIPRPARESQYGTMKHTFNVTWSNTPSFAFSVQRVSNDDTIFSTFGSKLVYEDQFIEFVTSMPEDYNVYGLGERIHGLRLGNNLTATTYAADTATPMDFNIYGSHPVYLDTRYFEQVDGNWALITGNESNYGTSYATNYTSYSHVVYNRNAHGQEVLMRESNITFRLLGGSIDLFFIDGPSPAEAIQGYQSAGTGYPAMQQYWSFGYHQCRWGYANWTQLQEVIDNFKKFNIPLETIWTDIDYMKEYRDFTTDPNTFPVPEGQSFLQRLHASNQHYVPIIDSAIYIPNPQNESDGYPTYNRGNSSGVFLKNPNGSQYIGSVWPGYTVFPDWHSENTVPWWVSEVSTWHQDIPFDGIWIDMSEVSSFCVGSCGTSNLTLNPVHPPFALPGESGNVNYNYPEGFNITNATEAASASSASAIQASQTASSASSTTTSYHKSIPTPGVRNINYPPYAINNVNGDLAVHAVSPNATHVDGVQEYDVHNLFGHQILNATYQALLNIFPGRRPLIIGRSTFAGSGKWAGHWGGDNNSKWADMFFSIPQALSFSIFGIPMFGVDTCGFNSQSDEELCNRWMQLSAFFPFYRNHNVLASNPQEPYVWASVMDATKKAMHIRYLLLPYIYTLFWSAHTKATTVMRALAWEFPSDPSLRAADRQFLLGPALLVTPVLKQGATSVNGVFPGMKDGTRWYDWYSETEVTGLQPGANVSIPAPLGHIPLFVRGGHILPLQEPGYTTTESRNGKWSLLVALDKNGNAQGEIYLDDGYSLEPNATTQVTMTAGQNALHVDTVGDYIDSNPLANIKVMGLSTCPQQVQLNGQNLGGNNFVYNSSSKALSVSGLDIRTPYGAWNASWTLSWA